MTAKKAIKVLEMFLHKQCDLERTKFAYDENEVWDAVHMASKALEKSDSTDDWIDAEIEVPVDDNYILLSFENFSIPQIGRYVGDEEGGAFFIGDDDVSCSSYGLFVNAWQLLPEPYKGE